MRRVWAVIDAAPASREAEIDPRLMATLPAAGSKDARTCMSEIPMKTSPKKPRSLECYATLCHTPKSMIVLFISKAGRRILLR